MRILFTNDDGVCAPGLLALVSAFSQAGHTAFVCAPDRERSAVGHGVSMRILHAKPMDMPGAARAWAVDGLPADCASLGLYLCRDVGVDMVVSGINRGMNQGGACVYSGTVAAALEASMCGFQGLAVSLCVRQPGGEREADYATAARVALRVAGWMPDHPLPRGVAYNLNVPPLPYELLRGIVPARLAPVYLVDPKYEESQDEQGRGFLYANGEGQPPYDPDYDTISTGQGYATLTKLTWDMRLNADDAELGKIDL